VQLGQLRSQCGYQHGSRSTGFLVHPFVVGASRIYDRNRRLSGTKTADRNLCPAGSCRILRS
jgi:hypothetical protein